MPDCSSPGKSVGNSAVRAAVAGIRPKLEEAEAELLFVQRRVNRLDKLLDETGAIVDAIELCEGLAKELKVKPTDSAMKWCLDCCDGRGQKLTESLDECFQMLLMFASSLHSFLHGHQNASKVPDLEEVRIRLHQAFSAVRDGAFEQSKIVELMDAGLMIFWAFIFALENLLQECEKLTAVTLGVAYEPKAATPPPAGAASSVRHLEPSVKCCPVWPWQPGCSGFATT
eukprot:gnl/TRDRNA2_/TRDRNA2_74651_c0_seq1.p1 gnl/TRDRNA2_/TRDRNA2_74651_c0~~gnl/TRDRNA2_/TRDRNA2_74651_c0_seq1.p1  ORF type:complete len:228 (+),score=31.10 gnl/TRDRNA2_/TRDRNA2_74651_c0_seq1:110-793(+)